MPSCPRVLRKLVGIGLAGRSVVIRRAFGAVACGFNRIVYQFLLVRYAVVAVKTK